jgi:hypothetical protein
MTASRSWVNSALILACALAFAPRDASAQLPSIDISASQPTVFEGNPGGPAVAAVFTVKLSAPTSQDVSFVFSTFTFSNAITGAITGTSCATANQVNGTDFIGISNELVTIPANTDSVEVPVTICQDTVVEHQTETFGVSISDIANAFCDAGIDCLSQGHIFDDDEPPFASINSVSVREPLRGTTPMTFTVSLSHPHPGFDVKVNFATRPNTALAGFGACGSGNPDYFPTSGQLDFPPTVTTKTFVVQICGDGIPEQTETFFADITGGTNISSPFGSGVGTIINFLVPTFGTFDVSPVGAEAQVGEWVKYRFEWTVSTGVWRDLDTLELRVRERGTANVPLWIKWTEHTNTFQVCEGPGQDADAQTPAEVRCGQPVAVGTPLILAGRHGSLDVGSSTVTGSGPTGQSVALELLVRLDNGAGNKAFDVEVAALSDSGIRDDFIPGASLVIYR